MNNAIQAVWLASIKHNLAPIGRLMHQSLRACVNSASDFGISLTASCWGRRQKGWPPFFGMPLPRARARLPKHSNVRLPFSQKLGLPTGPCGRALVLRSRRARRSRWQKPGMLTKLHCRPANSLCPLGERERPACYAKLWQLWAASRRILSTSSGVETRKTSAEI